MEPRHEGHDTARSNEYGGMPGDGMPMPQNPDGNPEHTIDPQLAESFPPVPHDGTEPYESSHELIPDDHWSRFHWATPLLSLWKVWAALAAGAFSIIIQAMEEGFTELWEAVTGISSTVIFIVAGVFLAISLVIMLISWLIWRKQMYVLAPSGVHYRSGIFSETHRHVRWDRIQSVEIKQGIIPRIFGLGSIMIDSASTAGGNVSLGLLKMNQIQGLRGQILQIAQAARAGSEFQVERQQAEESGTVYDPDDDFMYEKPFYTLPTGRLVGSMLLSGLLIGALAAMAGVLVPLIWMDQGFSIGILAAAAGTFAALWGQFNSNHGLKMFLTKDGIRVRRGLTTTTTQTIPPRRIHAVSLEQPFLWRTKDWWRVRVLVAGSTVSAGDSAGEMQTRSVIMPVGKRADALDLLWTIVPNIGIDDLEGFFHDALLGAGPSRFFIPPVPAAKYLDPLRHRRNGIVFTPTVAALREGWMSRHFKVALHGHWQGLQSSQGPVQARLGLATFKLSLVRGDSHWIGNNFGLEQVHGFMEQERDIGLSAQAVDDRESIEEWAARVGVR